MCKRSFFLMASLGFWLSLVNPAFAQKGKPTGGTKQQTGNNTLDAGQARSSEATPGFLMDDDQQRTRGGISCPDNRSPLSDVVRTLRGVDEFRRKRKCVKCGREWWTKEETEVAF